MSRHSFPWSSLLLLAAVYTLLDAVKPVHIDDTAYIAYARQIARSPLDPYGFDFLWYQWPRPAFQILVPPVLPYWLAPATWLFPEQPWAWKAWLFPFSLLFVVALYRLLRRYARGLELPLLAMTVLSPAFLPSLNLLLDVPALALSLTGINLAADAGRRRFRGRRGWLAFAAGSGLALGLAMETKYTGVVGVAVVAAYALIYRQPLSGFVAALVASLVFIGCEGLMVWKYGDSHFWYHLTHGGRDAEDKLGLLPALVPICGAVGAPLVLFAAVALRKSSWQILSLLLAAAGSVAVLGMFEGRVRLWPLPGLPGPGASVSVHSLIHGVWGLGFFIVLVQTLLVLRRGNWTPWGIRRVRRADLFLLVWFVLELVSYQVLTPFPAVRRVFGLLIVTTLLVGRLASRTCRTRERLALLHTTIFYGAALGLLYSVVDWHDARAEQEAVHSAQRVIDAEDATPRSWYVGHWGFQFYAEQAGMKAVIPDASELQPGDWLVVPGEPVNKQAVQTEGIPLDVVHELEVSDPLPWRTVMGYYGGSAPLFHRSGPRVVVKIYRARERLVIKTLWD